jgi:transaldolase
MAKRTYHAYCSVLSSERWRRACNVGARPPRLLWAITGTKDPTASDVLYIKALAAASTINTMPEATLKAFADHSELDAGLSDDSEDTLSQFAKSGIDINTLAAQLQDDGAKSFVKSWNHSSK